MEKEKQLKLIEKYFQSEEFKENLPNVGSQIKFLLERVPFITQLEIYNTLEINEKHSLFDFILECLLDSMKRELMKDPLPLWFFEVLEGKLELPSCLKNVEFPERTIEVYARLKNPEK